MNIGILFKIIKKKDNLILEIKNKMQYIIPVLVQITFSIPPNLVVHVNFHQGREAGCFGKVSTPV